MNDTKHSLRTMSSDISLNFASSNKKKIVMEDDYYYDDYEDNYGSHYGEYSGTYAQDIAGYSDDVINDAFDGEQDAYWNID